MDAIRHAANGPDENMTQLEPNIGIRTRPLTVARSRLGLALWLAASLAAGFVGSQFMPGDWYASLTKPPWNPPGWVFAPVWTTLYMLMGIAAWLVWRRAGFAGARLALGLFTVQLVLNGLWSYIFFGIQRPGLALVEIIALWFAILATSFSFRKIHATAGVLFLPYLLWVTFAAALNLTLWRLNA